MLDAPMVDAAGDNPPQRAISLLLSRYVGQGPADFFASACRLMADPEPLPAASHLVARALREIESAIRDVLEPIVLSSAVEPNRSGGDGHRQVVLSILSGLNVAEDHPVALKWLGFTGSGSLAGQAHRNNLDGPPQVDAEFRQVFEDMTMILEWAVDRLEANYGRVFDAIDELLAGQPGPAACPARTTSAPPTPRHTCRSVLGPSSPRLPR